MMIWLPRREVWQPIYISEEKHAVISDGGTPPAAADCADCLWQVIHFMMKQTIYQYIQEHHMIGSGDRVCVACSGGADSVCLLMVLHALCTEGRLSCTLMACHLNHMLRGQESDDDEAFVRELCAELEIPLVCVREDVAELASCAAEPDRNSRQRNEPAEAHTAGLEAAGRAARELLYETCVRKYGASKIALAHHMDDQAETVLFHMARGAALAGLSGIRPVHGYKIRPLLGVRRREIESWLTSQGLVWRNDASNATDAYARNRIRHHILPVFEAEINTGAVRHIAEAAETMQLADQWIREEMRNRITTYLSGEDNTFRISRTLRKESEFVQRTVIMHALTALAGTHQDIALQHVRQVEDLMAGSAGRKQDLPHGITASAAYEQVVLQKKQMQPRVQTRKRETEAVQLCDAAAFAAKCRVPSSDPARNMYAELEGFRFMGKITETAPSPIPEKPYTKWINCDKITGSIAIRTRRPGDYIQLDAEGRRQTVKSWMINQKIPRELRDRIPLVVHEKPEAQQQGAEVLWVVGGRISASARVDSSTRSVLQLTAERID